MIQSLKHFIRKITYKYSDDELSLRETDSIELYWWRDKPNLGDSLNKDLISKLSGKPVVWTKNNSNKQFYTAVGSVIQEINDHAVVWGSGLISDKSRPVFPPKAILAVRGPLTHHRLEKLGISTPKVYGDPALLLSKFYKAKTKKKYKIGIIPHFIDKNSLNLQKRLPETMKIIDIQETNVQKFIDSINECENVLSSSLHGMIIADAFRIPSARVSFSDKIVGGDFKFHDYCLSVNRRTYKAVDLSKKILDESLLKIKFELGDIDQEVLLESCPFYIENI